MTQRIVSCLFILLACAPFITSCEDENEPEIKTFSALADVSESDLVDEKYNMLVFYSTDGGATFVEHPLLKKGDTYKAKVVAVTDDGDIQVATGNCFAVDWSASNPLPTEVNTPVAEFVMQKDNALIAKITSTGYAPFDPSVWSGDWHGEEDGTCCSSIDDNTLRQDTSNPNKFIMDNFWGDGVDAYIIFTPSTNAGTQVVTIPEQTTSEGGVASGTGTYDQCTVTFTIATTYKIGGGTYVFDYNFHR
ncbi:MAG TPA: hypothetical protein VK508_13490 [Cyclobacteriaceae bacterium]|nr:hypothetical protein [Cyclobacteriaceae bacterium]